MSTPSPNLSLHIAGEVRQFIDSLPLSDSDRSAIESLSAMTSLFLLARLDLLKEAGKLNDLRAVHDGAIAAMMKMSVAVGAAELDFIRRALE